MIKTDQISFIREKCIEANPNIVVNKHAQIIHQDHRVEYFEQKRPIHLADVLLTYHKGKIEAADTISEAFGIGPQERKEGVYSLVACWNLRADDLREQSEETVAFIHSLLS